MLNDSARGLISSLMQGTDIGCKRQRHLSGVWRSEHSGMHPSKFPSASQGLWRRWALALIVRTCPASFPEVPLGLLHDGTIQPASSTWPTWMLGHSIRRRQSQVPVRPSQESRLPRNHPQLWAARSSFTLSQLQLHCSASQIRRQNWFGHPPSRNTFLVAGRDSTTYIVVVYTVVYPVQSSNWIRILVPHDQKPHLPAGADYALL